MIDYHGNGIPITHYLITGHKEGLYMAGLLALIKKVPDLNPAHDMANFEQVIKNLLIMIFKGIDIQACCFHFSQAVAKKLKSVGLQSYYLNTPAIKKWRKKYIAFCNLPAHFIQDELEKMRRETAAYPNRFVQQKMAKFEMYFIRYWMVQKTPAGFTTLSL